MLGKLSVPGHSPNLDNSRARAFGLAVGAGEGCSDIFSLIFLMLLLSPSLEDYLI